MVADCAVEPVALHYRLMLWADKESERSSVCVFWPVMAAVAKTSGQCWCDKSKERKNINEKATGERERENESETSLTNGQTVCARTAATVGAETL